MIWKPGRFFRKAEFTGVDIGTEYIKVAAARVASGAPEVTALALTPTPPAAWSEGLRAGEVGAALEKIVAEAGAPAGKVVAAVTGEKVISRDIRVPPMPRKELESALRWEAERYIPVPLEELVVRSVVLGEAKGERGPELHVLLAAAPERLVRDYHELFLRAGLNLVAVDLQSLALWRLFVGASRQKGAGSWAILDIGAKFSQLVIVREGEMAYTRVLPQGGSGFEGIKTLDGSGSGRELSEIDSTIFRMAFEDYARQVQRSLDWYLAQERQSAIERVLLSGGAANIEGIAGHLAELLGVPVEIGEPPLRFSSRLRQTYNPSFAVAIGLALWGLVR